MNTYGSDSNGQDVLLSIDGGQVMMEWEKPYMDASIDYLSPKGDVLEIGFGLGYSATRIVEKWRPKSYTVIECDPIVLVRAREWAQEMRTLVGSDEGTQTRIRIIEGRWQDVLGGLGVFDEIYFDDYPLDVTQESSDMEKILSRKRINVFVDICIQLHTRIGSKLCWYLNAIGNVGLSSDTEPFVTVCSRVIDIHIPDTCSYRDVGVQKCMIPLVTKVKEFDFAEAQRVALLGISTQAAN